jgi:hypothetical protein
MLRKLPGHLGSDLYCRSSCQDVPFSVVSRVLSHAIFRPLYHLLSNSLGKRIRGSCPTITRHIYWVTVHHQTRASMTYLLQISCYLKMNGLQNIEKPHVGGICSYLRIPGLPSVSSFINFKRSQFVVPEFSYSSRDLTSIHFSFSQTNEALQILQARVATTRTAINGAFDDVHLTGHCLSGLDRPSLTPSTLWRCPTRRAAYLKATRPKEKV